MTSLRPYQQELLNILENPTNPQFGVVTSIPGSGIRRPIEIHLCKIALTSRVLILCRRRIAVEQWAARLQDCEEVPVTVMTSADAALELLEGRPTRKSGVLIATYARTQHGPSSRALSELNFGLIVHDEPFQSFPDKVERLNSQAQRGIAIVDWQRRDSWAPKWPLLWNMSIGHLVREGYLDPVDVPYEPASEERALRDEAIGVLREFAGRQEITFALPSDSLPALHARLLTLASDPERHLDLSERAWVLLDRIENLRFVESRLVALDRVLMREMSAGARCIIMTATRTDARYIADHLANTGKMPLALLTSTVLPADRGYRLSQLRPGEYIVATHAACATADDWPTGLTLILWPSSLNRRMLDELFLRVGGNSNIIVLELSEINRFEPSAL